MTGNPTVRGVNRWNGAVLTAADRLNSYIGGSPSGKAIPVVALRARGGVASSLIDVVTGNDARACPSVTSLRVSVPYIAAVVTLASRLQVCGYFDVHPFVPGLTGGNR